MPYVTYEVVEIGQAYGLRPDVGVWYIEPTPAASALGTAAISAASVESLVALEIPLYLHRVEVRTAAQQQLVTVVEILSSVNKRPGHEAHLASTASVATCCTRKCIC
jgi:Protein of unknown function (DUF4058)